MCVNKDCECESNKRLREDTQSKGQTIMDAFRSRMRAAVRARKEREAAAQAIDAARTAIREGPGDSDDETAPPNGFDDIVLIPDTIVRTNLIHELN